MNLEEAANIIDKYGLMLESPEFNALDMKRLGKHAAMTAKSHEDAGRNSANYEDDKRYNDWQGVKWLNVKNRDEKTLISAIIDGICDVQLTDYDEHIADAKDELANNPNSRSAKMDLEQCTQAKEELKTAYKNVNTVEELKEFAEEHFDIEENTISSILKFLKKYSHGHTTVYRGFTFTKDEYEKLVGNADVRKIHSMLQFLNNKTKKFNSFTTSPIVASEFAGKKFSKNKTFIIAGEVEPNDINFAFTAYLMGRHGTISEYELNINNIKDIKNLRIVEDIDAEIERAKKYTLSVPKLQKELDSGRSINDVFDSIIYLSDEIGDAIRKDGVEANIGLYNGYCVILADNKIVTPFFRGMCELVGNPENKVIKIYESSSAGMNLGTRLCKLGKGYITDKPFNSITSINTSNFAVLRSKDGEYYLVDLITGRMVFKNAMDYISYIGKQGSGMKWPDDWFIIVTPNKDETIITSDKQIAFIGALKTFKSINFVKHEMAVKVTYNNSGRELSKKYVLKNNKLVETYE